MMKKKTTTIERVAFLYKFEKKEDKICFIHCVVCCISETDLSFFLSCPEYSNHFSL